MKQLNFAPPDILKDVLQFVITSQADMVTPPHQMPKQHVIDLAYKLIDEEVNKELLANIQKLKDGAHSPELMATILDDIVDSVYVIMWTSIVFSLPFNPAWHEVQTANMSKFPIHSECNGAGCDHEYADSEVTSRCVLGRIVTQNAATGKVVKPSTFTPPDIWGVLYECWTKWYLQQYPSILKEPSRRN